MAQDIPQLIADARTLLTTLPYQATERLTLLATVDQLETAHAVLRLFRGAAYPVSEEINERGYNWSEASLDEALENALSFDAVILLESTKTGGEA